MYCDTNAIYLFVFAKYSFIFVNGISSDLRFSFHLKSEDIINTHNVLHIPYLHYFYSPLPYPSFPYFFMIMLSFLLYS